MWVSSPPKKIPNLSFGFGRGFCSGALGSVFGDGGCSDSGEVMGVGQGCRVGRGLASGTMGGLSGDRLARARVCKWVVRRHVG